MSSAQDGEHRHHLDLSVTVPTMNFALELIRHALKEVKAIEDQMRKMGVTDFDDHLDNELTFADTLYSDIERDIREKLGLYLASAS